MKRGGAARAVAGVRHVQRLLLTPYLRFYLYVKRWQDWFIFRKVIRVSAGKKVAFYDVP